MSYHSKTILYNQSYCFWHDENNTDKMVDNNFSLKQIYNYWTKKQTKEEGLTINPLLDGPDGVGVTGQL